MNGRNLLGDSHSTRSTPSYAAASGEMATALGTAAVLQLCTVAAMLLLADTVVADLVSGLFGTPIVGVIVIGAGLTAGRYLGMRGLRNESVGLAALGALLSVATYGVFGAAILTPYSPGVYVPALGIAGAITILIAAVAGAVVLATDRSFESWGRYSGYFFLAGLGAALVGTFVTPVLLLAFPLFLLGFLIDLVYEIWALSSGRRSPLVNGFGLYIAFAGVFVHVLQIVLQFLGSRE